MDMNTIEKLWEASEEFGIKAGQDQTPNPLNSRI